MQGSWPIAKAGKCSKADDLHALATDAAGQLDILGEDRHALGVDGTQVRVLEEANEVGLGSLLDGSDSVRVELDVGLEALGDLPDKPLERKLADEQIRVLLVLTDLAKRHGARPETVGLLDTTLARDGLTGSRLSQLGPGRLATSGFASSLLSASHENDSWECVDVTL